MDTLTGGAQPCTRSSPQENTDLESKYSVAARINVEDMINRYDFSPAFIWHGNLSARSKSYKYYRTPSYSEEPDCVAFTYQGHRIIQPTW